MEDFDRLEDKKKIINNLNDSDDDTVQTNNTSNYLSINDLLIKEYSLRSDNSMK